ncbi:MAG: CP12 domain-containing protein [Microcoleaceae cyanobacterium]
MCRNSSDRVILAAFPQADSVTNIEDIDSAKFPIAWAIFEEFLASTVDRQRQEIVSLFNDYCRQNPNAVECSIYPS